MSVIRTKEIEKEATEAGYSDKEIDELVDFANKVGKSEEDILKKIRSVKAKKSLEFRGKEVEIDQGTVKLFYKVIDDEEYFLLHSNDGGSYVTNFVRGDGEETAEVTAGTPLYRVNTIFENKFVKENVDYLDSAEEVRKMLREAGAFIKKNQYRIFPAKKGSFKRSKKEQLLLDSYYTMNKKFTIVVDEDELELFKYSHEDGVYTKLSEKEFARLLKQVVKEEFFEDEVRKIMGLFKVERKESDDYIAFKNCLLDTNTLTIRNFTPKIFTKFQVPYNWNPNASSPEYEAKLRDILDDDEKFNNYITTLGYCFTKKVGKCKTKNLNNQKVKKRVL